MFFALVITPDRELAEGIVRLSGESGQVVVTRHLQRYPTNYELARILGASAPDIIFLDLSELEEFERIVRQTRETVAETAFVGLASSWEGANAEELCRQMDIQFLAPGLMSLSKFRDAVKGAMTGAKPRPRQGLFAFLPSKAGCGATVTALNVAACLAGPLGQRVILIEGDLRSGVLRTLTRTQSEGAVQDVLAKPSVLNHGEWGQFVARTRGFDLVTADRSWKGSLPDWSSYYHLLKFACAEYRMVLVDLPELVNDATAEVVRSSERVLVVMTPELLSFTLARQRCAELIERQVEPERIEVVLTRWHESDPPLEQIETAIGHRLAGVVPNDYYSLRKAALEGGLVLPGTAIGKAYSRLAGKLAGFPGDETPAPSPASLLSRARASLEGLLGPR